MSKGEEYFLRDWTIQEMMIDGDRTPHDTPEPVEKGHTFRFHRQANRIVCQSIRRNGPRLPWEDAWEATAFVYEPDHDRLLGAAVLGGKPWMLEITRWSQPNGQDGVRCGYVPHENVPHEARKPDSWHMGYWHGDGL